MPPDELEIIVVDGGSDDGTIEWLMAQPDIITIVQHNRAVHGSGPVPRRPWGYFMNLGFRAATAPVVCMLSDDCLVVPGAIIQGLAVMESSRNVGAVAFYWRNWPEQRRYRVGYTFGNRLFVNHGLRRKSALESVGFADATGLGFYHADGDMCLRLWENGWVCLPSPRSFIEHYSHANIQQRRVNSSGAEADWLEYKNRWSHLGVPTRDWDTLAYEDQALTAERYWSKPSGVKTAKVRLELAMNYAYRRAAGALARK